MKTDTEAVSKIAADVDTGAGDCEVGVGAATTAELVAVAVAAGTCTGDALMPAEIFPSTELI